MMHRKGFCTLDPRLLDIHRKYPKEFFDVTIRFSMFRDVSEFFVDIYRAFRHRGVKNVFFLTPPFCPINIEDDGVYVCGKTLRFNNCFGAKSPNRELFWFLVGSRNVNCEMFWFFVRKSRFRSIFIVISLFYTHVDVTIVFGPVFFACRHRVGIKPLSLDIY